MQRLSSFGRDQLLRSSQELEKVLERWSAAAVGGDSSHSARDEWGGHGRARALPLNRKTP